jgi:hypothetical protein
MTDLTDAIQRGWATADPDAPEPTVSYFHDLQAFAAGLDGDELRQGLVQYGSTLRNLERLGDAVTALQQADEQFPDHASVKVFLALALHSAGRMTRLAG